MRVSGPFHSVKCMLLSTQMASESSDDMISFSHLRVQTFTTRGWSPTLFPESGVCEVEEWSKGVMVSGPSHSVKYVLLSI